MIFDPKTLMLYPDTDEHGTIWLDPSTFISEITGNCFFCRTSTNKIDINYEGYYCGNDDETINEELRRLDEA